MASVSDIESGPSTHTYQHRDDMDTVFSFRLKSAIVSGHRNTSNQILSNIEGYVKAGDVSHIVYHCVALRLIPPCRWSLSWVPLVQEKRHC